jgi:putative transposase
VIKLGIVPQRIEAGHPEQNGRHERMHRTLKESTPPQANRRSQQRSFDQFREEYNQVRPHQALGMQTPAEIYTSSPRHFPARLKEPEYDTTVQVRRVQKHGEFRWKTSNVFLSHVLYGERVGLLPVDDRYFRICFSTVPIARLDTRKLQVERLWDEDLKADD